MRWNQYIRSGAWIQPRMCARVRSRHAENYRNLFCTVLLFYGNVLTTIGQLLCAQYLWCRPRGRWTDIANFHVRMLAAKNFGPCPSVLALPCVTSLVSKCHRLRSRLSYVPYITLVLHVTDGVTSTEWILDVISYAVLSVYPSIHRWALSCSKFRSLGYNPRSPLYLL